eukprot:Gregarina_sp_Poly_1__1776@NODE_145_length_12880_cov_78_207602_g130_i0_p4_GENE_NODE_145_length_12880_cov_78_207602_g130_i0NODE_145_length_12880_cov_78_207602_g130_i0_p4_ORF_typecomplete_len151_score10_56LLC1/PF14945_6/0_2_NODE_145_length_12880_cov_78_207602_g130_i047825234
MPLGVRQVHEASPLRRGYGFCIFSSLLAPLNLKDFECRPRNPYSWNSEYAAFEENLNRNWEFMKLMGENLKQQMKIERQKLQLELMRHRTIPIRYSINHTRAHRPRTTQLLTQDFVPQTTLTNLHTQLTFIPHFNTSFNVSSTLAHMAHF